MLVSVKEAAEKLNVSNRAIQIKCNKQGIVKIGNQYQITQEVLERWISSNDTKERNESETKQTISHTKRNEVRSLGSFYKYIMIVALLLLVVVSAAFYIDLNTQINDANATIKTNDTNYRTELKRLSNELNNAKDVIHRKDLQLQYYRLKDSLKYIKKSRL
jgi:hypothetical protein